MIKKPTFDDSVNIIVREIEKRRNRWQLTAVPYMDFDDVKSIILNHIYRKWDLFLPERGSLECWVSRIITNQISNILRNQYYSFAKICKRCPASEGDDEYCRIYGKQDAKKCKLLRKWEKSKMNAYNIKIPLTIEHHSHELSTFQNSEAATEQLIERLCELLKQRLTTPEYTIFTMSFLENRADKDILLQLGYKPKSNNGMKFIVSSKKKIQELATNLVRNEEHDF